MFQQQRFNEYRFQKKLLKVGQQSGLKEADSLREKQLSSAVLTVYSIFEDCVIFLSL